MLSQPGNGFSMGGNSTLRSVYDASFRGFYSCPPAPVTSSSQRIADINLWFSPTVFKSNISLNRPVNHTATLRSFFREHKIASWTLGIAGLLILAVLAFTLFFDWNSLRPALARSITQKTGCDTSIQGDLKVHLLSWTPRAEINGLSIKNPSWADGDVMFAARRISVSVSLGRLLRGQVIIPEIAVVDPKINLQRDAGGRTNWDQNPSSAQPKVTHQPAKIPIIRRLIIQDGQLHVVDLVRKLRFGGTLVASDTAGDTGQSALRIRAQGTLNEKPFTLAVDGGPLLELSPERPYSFSAHVGAADIKLDTKFRFDKPFDMASLKVNFDVSGHDLADVFYLTGLALPNTPSYQFAASVTIAGTTYQVSDLKGRIGSSDIAGSAEVLNEGQRPKLTAKLISNNLNLADLAPSLGHPMKDPKSLTVGEPKMPKPSMMAHDSSVAMNSTDPSKRLLPDAQLQLNRVRGMNADVTYHAGAVTAAKLPMKSVGFHLLLNQGLLSIDPLSFVLDEGRFAGSVRIDARGEVETSEIDMTIDHVDLSQIKTKALTEPPLTGTLVGRLKLAGTGSSIHKFASTANGAFSVVIPHGEINRALAELTGINVLQGLGLLLVKKEDKTQIRCSVIDLRAKEGVLDAKTFFIDTTDVLITGTGEVNLDSEKLDISLEGKPKAIRMTRLRSPITFKGTLADPSVGINVPKLAAQTAVATALGALLTPAAAVLAFIDPGLAKNQDCVKALGQQKDPFK